MDAYLAGLEQAKANGHDLSKIDSVASFFVSRVDTEVDKRLDKIGTDEAKALRGKAAIANARLAYEAYEEVFATDRWQALRRRRRPPAAAAVGLHRRQGPDYHDTLYVDELVAPGTVNTMPEATLDAVADHGEITRRHRRRHLRRRPGRSSPRSRRSASTTTTSSQVLEDEGVEKFEASWNEPARTSDRGASCERLGSDSEAHEAPLAAESPDPRSATRCATRATGGCRGSRGRAGW